LLKLYERATEFVSCGFPFRIGHPANFQFDLQVAGLRGRRQITTIRYVMQPAGPAGRSSLRSAPKLIDLVCRVRFKLD
jgi:hypothetical protein